MINVSPVIPPVEVPTVPAATPVETQEEYTALVDLQLAVYKATDIDEIVSKQDHLASNHKELLRAILRKHT
jgi:hypothetical protein